MQKKTLLVADGLPMSFAIISRFLIGIMLDFTSTSLTQLKTTFIVRQ